MFDRRWSRGCQGATLVGTIGVACAFMHVANSPRSGAHSPMNRTAHDPTLWNADLAPSDASQRTWDWRAYAARSEEHTSELQSLMRISYAVFCLKKQKYTHKTHKSTYPCTI